MPLDSIYYLDPQPTQGKRFVPIPAQGDTPPKYRPEQYLSLVRAWDGWLLPDRSQPDFHLARIATLTIVYGASPSFATGQRDIDLLYETLGIAWLPPDPPPQRDRRYIAPLTLAYGDQPPPYSTVQLIAAAFANQPWIPSPQRDAKNFAPLSIVYGDQPPRYTTVWHTQYAWLNQPWVPPPPRTIPRPNWSVDQPPVKLNPVQYAMLIRSWDGWLVPDRSQPNLTRDHTVPLTLVYGDQPPSATGLRDIDLATEVLATAWLPADPSPQPDLRHGHLAPLTLSTVDQPPRYSTASQTTIVASWQPRPPQPPADRRYVAPLTLATGQQPPMASGLRNVGLFYETVTLAWQPGPPQPQRDNKQIATLSLPRGDQPPPRNFEQLALVSSWLPVPPQPQQDRKYVAPLTLRVGDKPPPYSVAKQMLVIGTWQPWPPPSYQRDLKHTLQHVIQIDPTHSVVMAQGWYNPVIVLGYFEPDSQPPL